MTTQAPFVRPLYGPGDHRHVQPGIDVVAVKRALSRAGYFPWRPGGNFDARYNAPTVAAVKAFQKQAGIRPTGHYGMATHEALRLTRRKGHPSEWAFDAAAAALLRQAAHVEAAETAADRAAKALVDAAAFWIVHADESHYAQVRPFPLVVPPQIPVRTDCSGFVTTCFYAAGAPDPNVKAGVSPYSGYGYTGTLVAQGQPIEAADADAGCLAFYGSTTTPSPAFPVGSPTHVALCLPGGYVASDGQESGPAKYDLDYRPLHSVRRYPLVKEA